MNAPANFAFGNKQNPVPVLCAEQGRDVRALRWKQVHGTKIVEVVNQDQDCGEADGFWTRQKSIVIGVITADCVPILLYRRDGRAVGAIHAGWRGVAQHIVRSFFESLPADYANPLDWCAVIGPSIRACCYEFGAKELVLIADQFRSLSLEKLNPSESKLDLLAPIKHELDELGVELATVNTVCTFCTEDGTAEQIYFSYRRGDRNSRQFSVIQRANEKPRT